MDRRSFIASSAAVALVAQTPPARIQAQADALRIGAVSVDLFAQPYYAQEMAFFRKVDLAVEIHTFPSVAPIGPAIAAGDLDLGGATPVLLANAAARGVPLVMFAGGALDTASAPIALLCVLAAGPVRSPKDLEGKTVAVAGIRGLSDVALDLWLSRNGADPTKVGRVESVQAAMAVAVRRGTVAGALLTEPFLSSARKAGDLRALGDPFQAIASQSMASCWYGTTMFAQKSTSVIKKFQAAMQDASRWANDHHFDSARILARTAQIDVDVVRAMSRCLYAEEMRVADLQPEVDLAVKVGIVPKAINAADLIFRS